jgi:hypothetical protein
MSLGAETQVLTDMGYVQLQAITKAMKVWDGVSWVKHGGKLKNPVRKILFSADGVYVAANQAVCTRVGLEDGNDYNSSKFEDLFMLSTRGVQQALVAGSYSLPKGKPDSPRVQPRSEHSIYGDSWGLVNAGTQNRFTIKTETGHWLVGGTDANK